MADKLAVAVNQGANAVTYWQYVDRDYTQQDGGWAWLVTQVIHTYIYILYIYNTHIYI